MKNLNGKELMRGDLVLTAAPDGTVVAGQVHQFVDRNEVCRIASYPFWVPAKNTVLAQDAFEAFALPLLKARDEEEAKAKQAQAPEPPKPQDKTKDTSAAQDAS